LLSLEFNPLFVLTINMTIVALAFYAFNTHKWILLSTALINTNTDSCKTILTLCLIFFSILHYFNINPIIKIN
jgi:hypothetical protein